MKNYPQPALLVLLISTLFSGIPAQADNMASIAITPATGVVTLVPRWSLAGSLAGFHHMSQDLSLGGGANQFYSIKSTTIPMGGDIAAFKRYIAGSGATTSHGDIGSKLTPDSYSALTSADPDIGYGSTNFYFIHHKSTGDYFATIVPGSATSSAVTDRKPMSGPGGPATLGASGYFGLTFAAANLGYGLNLFYYFRTDSVTGYTLFGTLEPALLGSSADQFDLGIGGYNALAFTGTDVGYGTDKMYYLRLEPITGYTVLGTLDPVTGQTSDIANLGSVFTTLTFVPGDLGFGAGRFYTTGAVNPTWQSVSFAAIADRALSAGSFTVHPTASSGLPITLTVVSGSAAISSPIGGVFTVTPLAGGLVILQATQAGAINPTAYEYNMLRQSFLVSGSFAAKADFNADGKSDLIWQNTSTGQCSLWLMNGTTFMSGVSLGVVPLQWSIAGTGDFNADGKSDLLWQNTSTGECSVWLMNGTTFMSGVSLGVVPLQWSIVSTGDFNADGKSDLLWQNTGTGECSLWLMNGTTFMSGVSLGAVPLQWSIAGTGDFNADGKSDLLWQNTSTGECSVWLMNGTTFMSGVSLGAVPLQWSIAGTGDFNADGKSDLIWQNTSTGQCSLWLMNGTTLMTGISLGVVPLEWSLANK